MEVTSDQAAAVESAHRMRDDMDRTLRKFLLDFISELACPLVAGIERRHVGKQRLVLALEAILESVEVVDSENVLRHQKAARKYEVHAFLQVKVAIEAITNQKVKLNF